MTIILQPSTQLKTVVGFKEESMRKAFIIYLLKPYLAK